MKAIIIVLAAVVLSSCAVIRQDEIAMKRRMGKLVGEPVSEKTKLYNPFTTSYIKVPLRNINFEISIDIPSKEGLNIKAEVSILYRLDPKMVPTILREVGTDYERDLISPVFRSALADVSAQFMAKDMHTGMRSVIEKAVQERMMEILGEKGFIIEAVLMKRILLPPSLSQAIEDKLSAEQEAQRMQFVLLREQQEAERRRIEAEGIRDAQKIMAEGLTENVLRYESIKAFLALATSQNAKVIITNGDNSLLTMPSE
jgi:regulator of protease activity HflC (stomatin/prohibitin superfamily)